MDGATQDDEEGAPSPRASWPAGGLAWDALFAAAGALAIVLQVTFLREFMVALSGDETALGVGLAAWLAGIAAGAAVARRARGRARFALLCFALLAASGPAGVVGGRYLRLAMAPPPGEILPLGFAVLLALAILAPTGALVGATFTSLAAAAAEAGIAAGRGIARLYVLESLGSLAGGAAQTFVLIPLLPPLRAASVAAATCVLLALPALVARSGPRLPGRAAWIGLAAVLLLLGIPALGGPLEEASLRARFAGLAPGIPLLRGLDTPYQHIALGGDGVRHLYAAGQYAGSFPDPIQSESRAHVLASLAPSARTILAIGAVQIGPLQFLLRHPVERIDIPEPDRRALALLRAALDRDDARALADPRVRIVHDDPRRFLARTAERYDLILILEPDPVTLFLARLTTREFYRLCAARLEPRGVLVVALRTAPNVLTGETARMAGAIFGALRSVFPVVRAGPGPEGLLVAGFSTESVTLDPALLARRWEGRAVAAEAFVPEMFGVLFPPERVRAQESALARAADATPASEDDRPVSFIHALARREAISGGATGLVLSRLGAWPGWALVLAALVPSALALLHRVSTRRRTPTAVPSMHVAAATGTCGMVWSLLLVFSFQTRAGALYGDLGLLTAAFMLGLAAGGTAAFRAASAGIKASRSWLLCSAGAACAFGFVLAGVLRLLRHWPALPGAAALLIHSGLLLAAGAVTGAVFPSAVGARLSAGSGAREAAGAIEAADHAGASLAALFAALLFVPRFGLVGTALLVAGIEACAVAALGVALRGPEAIPGASSRSQGS